MTDIGLFFLRLALGALILFHGVAKLQGGITGIEGMLVKVGAPGWFAYAVYVGEVVAPLMLMVGYYARIGAALIVVNMVVAITLAHAGMLFSVGRSGGWALELQGMYLFTAIALVLLGPGRFSFDRS